MNFWQLTLFIVMRAVYQHTNNKSRFQRAFEKYDWKVTMVLKKWLTAVANSLPSCVWTENLSIWSFDRWHFKQIRNLIQMSIVWLRSKKISTEKDWPYRWKSYISSYQVHMNDTQRATFDICHGTMKCNGQMDMCLRSCLMKINMRTKEKVKCVWIRTPNVFYILDVNSPSSYTCTHKHLFALMALFNGHWCCMYVFNLFVDWNEEIM